MNKLGIVRSASEFKEIFEDIGESTSPYRCPFCEVPYEERCIVTECVKAPHFKLPDGTVHRNGCNGEIGDAASTSAATPAKASVRRVVGEIDVPEALVSRRQPKPIGRPWDYGLGVPPDATEVSRRRGLVAADDTISSRYTASSIRTIVHAYKRLRKLAGDAAIAAKLERATPEYNGHFRKTLSLYPVALHKHKLNYGNAFQGCKLSPWREERIYYGSGKLRLDGAYFAIEDEDTWPQQPKTREGLVPFEVKLNRSVASDAPTSHAKAVNELERLALAEQKIDWFAYGLPKFQGGRFELAVDVLDHFYWIGQYSR